ncbi:MAG: hypothetical protein QOC92_2637 [Acidimicrobiaceae bacterium]
MNADAPSTTEVIQAGERRSARIESLRAIAALAVLTSHVWLYSHNFGPSSFDSLLHRAIAGGGFGVQLFFALSGFLIFRPFARRDFGGGARIDLWTYARNRALRILPLYWFAVVALLVFTQDGGSATQWWRFTLFAQGFSEKTAQAIDGPMWSVVVELHFYLLLPLLAWALAKVTRGQRRPAIAVLLLAALASIVLRRMDPDPQLVWAYSLPATFYGFVPGMVLALLQLEWEENRPRWLRGALSKPDVWLGAAAAVWVTIFWTYDWSVPLVAVASFLTVGAVVLPLERGRLVRALDWRPLALVGVASYSLYIWHVPIIERLADRPALDSFPRLFAVALPLALLIAAVSYLIIERPALRSRRVWVNATAATATRHPINDRWWVALIALVGFFVRARTVMATRHLVLGSDPWDYNRLGQLLAAGKGFGSALLSPSGGPTAFRPPLYPLFLGAIYKVTGDSIVAARLVQAGLGAATVVLLWLIAVRLFDRRTAHVVAALAAVYPPLVLTTTALMSESILIPIMLMGLLAALIAREQGPSANWWIVLTGACAGLGILARPSSVTILPALVLLVLARPRTNWRASAAMKRAGLVVGAVAVVLLPWQLRNAAKLHHFVPVSDIDGYNLAGLYNPDAAGEGYPTHFQWRPPTGVADLAPLFGDRSLDEVTLGARLRSSGFEFIRRHPTSPIEAELWNSYRMLELTGLDQSAQVAEQSGYSRRAAAVAMVSFWMVAVLAAAGCVTRSFRRAPPTLWLAPALLWVGTALFLGDARQRAPVDPFILLAASLAVVGGIARISALSARRHETL